MEKKEILDEIRAIRIQIEEKNQKLKAIADEQCQIINDFRKLDEKLAALYVQLQTDVWEEDAAEEVEEEPDDITQMSERERRILIATGLLKEQPKPKEELKPREDSKVEAEKALKAEVVEEEPEPKVEPPKAEEPKPVDDRPTEELKATPEEAEAARRAMETPRDPQTIEDLTEAEIKKPFRAKVSVKSRLSAKKEPEPEDDDDDDDNGDDDALTFI